MFMLTLQEGSSTEHRIKTLNASLQFLVYLAVCRSLFKADRLMFALHMVHGMFPEMFKENVSSVYTCILLRYKGSHPQ